MDFLKFNLQYSILICTHCEYAILPTGIRAHLKAKHSNELSKADIKAYTKAYSAYNITPPAVMQQYIVPPNTLPIPHLKTFPDGIRCLLCETDTPYICRSRSAMRDHLKDLHSWKSTDSGGRLLGQRRGQQGSGQAGQHGGETADAADGVHDGLPSCPSWCLAEIQALPWGGGNGSIGVFSGTG